MREIFSATTHLRQSEKKELSVTPRWPKGQEGRGGARLLGTGTSLLQDALCAQSHNDLALIVESIRGNLEHDSLALVCVVCHELRAGHCHPLLHASCCVRVVGTTNVLEAIMRKVTLSPSLSRKVFEENSSRYESAALNERYCTRIQSCHKPGCA